MNANWDNNEVELSPKYGQSFGMIVRHQITNTFSLETGLSLVNRRYELSIANTSISLQDQASVNLRSYDWPIQILSYVRVAENYYLNASFGNAITIFPSDIISYGTKYDYFFVSTARRRKMQSAFIANLGMEYRTKAKEYITLVLAYTDHGKLAHAPFLSTMMVQTSSTPKHLQVSLPNFWI